MESRKSTLSTLLPDAGHSSRIFSFASTFGATEVDLETEGQLILSLRDSKRRLQVVKMAVVVLLPVLALTAIISVTLSGIVNVEQHAVQTKPAVDQYLLLHQLCKDLQIERTAIAQHFVQSRANPSEVDRNYSTTERWLGQTDSTLNEVTFWAQPNAHCFPPECIYPSKEDFVAHLQQMRESPVGSEDMTNLGHKLAAYTEAMGFFTVWAERVIKLPKSDRLRDCLIAANALLRASNAMSLMEALGFVYFSACTFKGSNYHAMWKQSAAEVAFLEIAFTYCPKGRICYKQNYVDTPLHGEITSLTNTINSKQYEDSCNNASVGDRLDDAKSWLASRRKYTSVVDDLKEDIIEEVHRQLSKLINSLRVQIGVYATLLATVLVMSAGMAYWYINSISHMLVKIKQFANGLTVKKHQLKGEKEKTDTLLRQMLPWSVAEQLKTNSVVSAEYFESITVYFSDIVGFSKISSMSSPHQVVDMLNSLYSTFDTAIERYRVYKVETVGDSYMVAGGLPERTDDHAAEIAHMSLELILAVKDCIIPHLPGERLQVRIGIHTGAAVAGVVGLTMPRYCLFGDTINTASRMETTCLPQRIQISEACKEALDKHGGFKTDVRGSVLIKGKGSMMTYWLFGCAHLTVCSSSNVVEYHKAHAGYHNSRRISHLQQTALTTI